MGRVRTKLTKRSAKLIIEKYYPRLTLDFQTNKRVCGDVAIIPTKPLRNKIAGYVTHLMKRMVRGPVRGISVKLQEEERERRDNWVPDVSAVQTTAVPVDETTKAMLEELGYGELDVVVSEVSRQQKFYNRRERKPRDQPAAQSAAAAVPAQ